ncbi:MAG: hypothetical protein ACFFCQ_05225 [Promethearchaeota archaeon]
MDSKTEALEVILKDNGLEVTPSALTLLKTCTISPEELVSGIRKDFPKARLITTKIAVDIVMLWPKWRGISPAVTEELKGKFKAKTKAKKIRKHVAIPPYLAQTLSALKKVQEGTAKDIANKTGRKTDTEAIYLSLLFKKRKVSRKKKKKVFVYRVKT